MSGRTFPIVAVVVALVLIGMAGLTILATGDSAGQPSGLLAQLHQAGARLHGGEGHGDHGGCDAHGTAHHEAMARLIEQLELTPEQHGHLERIHEIMESHHGSGAGSMAELHAKLVTQFADGQVDNAAIRRVVDEHVEQIRSMAYAVTDEFVALVSGLDAKQREILRDHLQEHAAAGRD